MLLHFFHLYILPCIHSVETFFFENPARKPAESQCVLLLCHHLLHSWLHSVCTQGYWSVADLWPAPVNGEGKKSKDCVFSEISRVSLILVWMFGAECVSAGSNVWIQSLMTTDTLSAFNYLAASTLSKVDHHPIVDTMHITHSPLLMLQPDSFPQI